MSTGFYQPHVSELLYQNHVICEILTYLMDTKYVVYNCVDANEKSVSHCT